MNEGRAVVRYMQYNSGVCTHLWKTSFFRSWGFNGTVTLLFQLVIFTGMVRVGVKIPQDGNRANRYGHVAMVHGHVWRTLCSVCATGARVAQPLPATFRS